MLVHVKTPHTKIRRIAFNKEQEAEDEEPEELQGFYMGVTFVY